MSTPAAKRRRVDAANAVLRKPFQSPVIRRPNDATEANPAPAPGTSSSSSIRTPDSATGKRSLEESYSPSSPSVPRQQQQQQQQNQQLRPTQGLGLRSSTSRGALRQTWPMSPLPKTSKAPGSAARAGDGRAVPGAHLGTLGRGDSGGDDNPFMALVNAHRTTGQQAMIRDIDKRLEAAQQARKIEAASEARRPGEPVDQELRDLIARWKGADRQAADELFEVVKDRVDSAGGPKAWRAMQQRQTEFYRGFDQESPTRSKAAGGEGEGEEEEGAFFQREVDYSLERERMQGGGRLDEDPDEGEDEPEFNMALMLRSLNIDLSLLGYDEAEEKWID